MGMKLSAMSDLHCTYSSDKGPNHHVDRIRMSFKKAAGDVLLLVGDITDKAEEEQFDYVLQCVEQEAAEKLVLCVAGNHDVLDEEELGSVYGEFQHKLLQRAVQMGYEVEPGPASSPLSYAVQIGNEIQVVGLNTDAVKNGQFLYQNKEEILTWLKEKLDRKHIKQNMILSHVPLLLHNPHRNKGQPYLNLDYKLQRLLDTYSNIIFLSGHTHYSPIVTKCVEYENGNLYLNCGSIVPPDLAGNEIMIEDKENRWLHSVCKNGMFMELEISDKAIQVDGKTILGGVLISKCHYVFMNN